MGIGGAGSMLSSGAPSLAPSDVSSMAGAPPMAGLAVPLARPRPAKVGLAHSSFDLPQNRGHPLLPEFASIRS